MTLVIALAVALQVGSGVVLMLRRDLIRVVAGALLLSNAAILFLLSVEHRARTAPILPVEDAAAVSDPVLQALALTGIVIGFGMSGLLLILAYRFYRAHQALHPAAPRPDEWPEER